ncbi:MAG: SH3 domain-containing protein [Oscillochloris sp.]|nr:SH3 domain-containing protein [Oscillochloris sp.]
MTEQQRDNYRLNTEMQHLEERIAELEAEAIKQQRRLDAARNSNQRQENMRGKGNSGTVMADTQRGEVESVEEELAELRVRLDRLRSGAAVDQRLLGEELPAPPELRVGGVARVTRSVHDTMRLRTRPGRDEGTVAQLVPGEQMTLLQGPEFIDDLRWWRVRTTSGGEGWISDEGLRATADNSA